MIIGLPPSKFPRDVFDFLVFLPAFLSLDRNRIVLLWSSPVLRVIGLILVYAGLTHLWGPPDEGLFDWRHLRSMVMIFGFVAMAAWLTARDERFLDILFLSAGWAAAIMAAVSIWLFATGAGASSAGRLIGWAWPDPNSSAAVVAVILLGLLDRISRFARISLLAAGIAAPVPLLLVFMALTEARAAAAGLFLGVAVLALAITRRRGISWKISSSVGGLLVAILATAAPRWELTSLLSTSAGYFYLWDHYFNLAMQKPWLGHGILALEAVTMPGGQVLTNAHNKIIDAFFYGGGIAVALLAALIVIAGQFAVRTLYRRGDGLPGALLAFCTIYTFGIPAVLPLFSSMAWWWIHCWLPLAIIAGVQIRDLLNERRAA
ncbi:MAG: O-antigen ligase family protein [Rhizobiaceae bacterium]